MLFLRRFAPVAAATALLCLQAGAQVSQVWSATIDGPATQFDTDTANRVFASKDGGCYSVGYTWIANSNGATFVAKHDANGNRLWLTTYSRAATLDNPVGAVIDASENLYVLVETDGGSATRDFTLLKFDSAGNQVWVRHYNRGFGALLSVPKSLAIDLTGNPIAVGYTSGPLGLEFTTVKYSSNGDKLWEHFSGLGIPESVATDVFGNIYLAGSSNNTNPTQFKTLKLSPTGDEVWSRTFAGDTDFETARRIALGPDDTIYVAGSTNTDGRLLAYTNSGDLIWSKAIRMFPNSLAVDSRGRVLLGGYTTSDMSNPNGIVASYTDAGQLDWKYEFDGGGFDVIFQVKVDKKQDVSVVGARENLDGIRDGAVLKFSKNGKLIWDYFYDDALSNNDELYDIALGDDRRFFCAGVENIIDNGPRGDALIFVLRQRGGR